MVKSLSRNDYNTAERISQDTKLKLTGQEIAASLRRLGYDSKAHLMEWCGNENFFSECACGCRTIGGYFCRVRWCPMCQKLRSKRFVCDTISILHRLIEIEPAAKFVFVTLTLPNCAGEDLTATINQMLYGWDKFTKNKLYRDNVKGYIRALQVTYNADANTYHPHIHALLNVKPNYFNYHSETYITREKLSATWAQVAKTEYIAGRNIPNVDIKAVRNKETGEIDVKAAVPETLKYALKTKDILAGDGVLHNFVISLTGRRTISFGGILRKIKAELKIPDVEDDNIELTDTDNEGCTCPVCNGTIKRELYRWNTAGGYYEYDAETTAALIAGHKKTHE